MKIRPLQDRVLVKRLEENTKTAGGIIIPDTAKEKPSEGIVEAVGPGMVSPEGKVIQTLRGVKRVKDAEERLLIKEPEILGIIEE